MKMPLPVIAFLAFAAVSLAAPPTVSFRVDVAKPQAEFQIRTASGATPTFRAFLLDDGAAWTNTASITNGALYYYMTNWPSTNWVRIPFGGVGSNYVDYIATAAETATSGVFQAYVVVQTTNQTLVWGHGTITIDYYPSLLYGGTPLNLALGGVELDPYGLPAALAVSARVDAVEGTITTGAVFFSAFAGVVTGTQSGQVASAYAHTTESSNTVHGGFIKTAYDWATNAYAYAGRAWDQATNALAVAQIVHAWGDHADAGYVTGDVVRAENDSVFTNWLGPVPPDPWSNPQFVDFGQRSPSGLWSLIFNAGVTLVSSAGDDFTVNDNLGAPLLELSQTVGAKVYPEIYALGGLRAPNSSGTNAITPSGLSDIGPALQKADTALQPAQTNGWEVGSHDAFVTADAPAWIAATNTELAITLTNDLERPQYLYATGAVTLAFAGLRPPQPFYLVVRGPDSLAFPSGTHFVGGASWQTNQANHFIVWQYTSNLYVNPVTTSTED